MTYEPATEAGRRLFTDNEPMDMYESDGVTWEDIIAIEREAAESAIGAGIDVDHVAETLHAQKLHPLGGACHRCREEARWFVMEYARRMEIKAEYARLTPQPGEPSPYAPESYMGGTADMIPVANLTPQPGEPADE